MPKPAPPGFVQIKKGNRYYLRCARTIKTPLGVVQCTYMVRKDTPKRDHKCTFITLETYKQLGDVQESKLVSDVAKIPFTNYLIDFVVDTNISFNAACSPAMTNLLRAAFVLGKKSLPSETEIEKIPHISRQALTLLFKKKAQEKVEKVYTKLSGCFVGLLLDASTDVAQGCLDICISHPVLNPKPIIVESLPSFGGTTDDYRIIVAKVIHQLRDKNIKVSGITSDNCIAQVMAINPRMETSFQYISNSLDDKGIMWVSCVCHILALGLHHFFNESIVSDLIEGFKSLVIELRRKPIRQFLKATCIAPSNTRWNVIFLQMMWIIKHRNELLLLYDNKSLELKEYVENIRPLLTVAMQETIPKLAPLLQLVNAVTNEAQADTFQAAYTFTTIQQLKNAIEVVPAMINERYNTSEIHTPIKDSIMEIATVLSGNIDEMYNKHSEDSLLKLMYLLTPEGRNEFRISFPAVIASKDPKGTSVGCKRFNRHLEELNCIIKYMDNLEYLINKFNSNESESTQSEEKTTSQESETMTTEEEEIELDNDDESSSSDDVETNEEDLIEINETREFKTEDPLSFFIDTLEEFLNVQYTPEQVRAADNSLINWVMMSTDDIGITPFIHSEPLKIWTFLRTKTEWYVLAYLL